MGPPAEAAQPRPRPTSIQQQPSGGALNSSPNRPPLSSPQQPRRPSSPPAKRLQVERVAEGAPVQHMQVVAHGGLPRRAADPGAAQQQVAVRGKPAACGRGRGRTHAAVAGAAMDGWRPCACSRAGGMERENRHSSWRACRGIHPRRQGSAPGTAAVRGEQQGGRQAREPQQAAPAELVGQLERRPGQERLDAAAGNRRRAGQRAGWVSGVRGWQPGGAAAPPRLARLATAVWQPAASRSKLPAALSTQMRSPCTRKPPATSPASQEEEDAEGVGPEVHSLHV